MTGREIEGFVARYLAAWNRLDPQALLALWDPAEPHPLYIAEEVEEPMWDHLAIERYFEQTRRAIARIRLAVDEPQAAPLAPQLARLFFRLRWQAWPVTIGRDDPPIGGEVKVTALLRETEPGWRLVQYVEAPLGPLPFLRRVYQQAGAG